MNQKIVTQFKAIVSDKPILIALVLFLVLCIALLVFLAFGIQPSERQIAIHYTSFGTTNFYRDKWFYLLSFAGYTLIMVVIHCVLTAKILQEKGRELALAFAWLGVLITIVAFAYVFQILKIASII